MPWKNGGGFTREMIRVPAGGDRFLWRVSIARIEAPGPFSHFSGYQRTMVLLQGAGVRLRFAGGSERLLREIGDLVEFDGDIATECELLDGDCTDLNLMVSSAMSGVRAWVERLSAPRVMRPVPRGVVLALAIDGAMSAEPAGEEEGSRKAARLEAARLEAWDLVVASADEPVAVRALRDCAAAPLVFFAALEDNSSEGAGEGSLQRG
jgi:environmental stress-induced protein Ves